MQEDVNFNSNTGTTDTIFAQINPRAWLTWFQLAVGGIAILSSISMFFVYKDRQDAMSVTIQKIQEDRNGRNADYEAFKLNQATRWATIESFMLTQSDINRKLEAHISDKSIHATEDQMKNFITAQLQPLAISLENAKVNIQGQDKTLSRIENHLRDLTNMLRAEHQMKRPAGDDDNQ